MNQALRFGPYRLDPGRGLWRGRQEVKLPPKALALLTALAERAGELVSKDEMLRAVWPETVVSDTALTSCIQELRHALHDDARVPRYIETRHRRGYRFIARTVIARPPRPPSFPRDAGRHSSSSRALVGRERELAQLRAWFARVREGERQVVFVTGEPGIGKTTLVEAFLAWAAVQAIRIGRGQCVEHYGAGEAYLPVFDALARLTRRSDGDRVVRTLATHAPTWLTQMPFLTGGSEQEALQRRVQGATRQRMLRELTDALETLVLDVPVVLSLEDLHWSDVSTLDWLAFLGRRTDRAPLMVIGTYRPEEVLAREHQLEVVMNELRVHRLCRELPLSPLREADVARYVARRLRGRPARALATEALTRLIHARSDGNPLFMVTIVDDLMTRADHRRGSERPPAAMTIEVPRDVRSMIVQQHRRLGAVDRRVLEAASVVGTEFTVPVVAASAGIGADDVEFACDGLAERGQFLVARGVEEWPDGTIAPRYAFVHALHREVLYEQVPVGRRARLHERAGGRLEAGWSGRANEIAAALAMHFEQAGSTERAVRYLHEAGTNAIRRNAPGEAIAHLTRAIELLGAFHGAARPEQELPLQIALGSQLMAIKGWGAPDVERAYGRAHRLARQVGDARGRFQVLWGLWLYHWGRGELAEAHALGEELLALAERGGPRARRGAARTGRAGGRPRAPASGSPRAVADAVLPGRVP